LAKTAAERDLAVRVLFLALGLMLLSVQAYAQPAPDTSGIGYRPQLGRNLPLDATFTDEDGRRIALGDIAVGRPTVLALGYYACPALCGVIRDDLLTALGRSGLSTPADYQVVFVSIDPHETVADAYKAWSDDRARYPTAGSGDGWHFLTGASASVAALEQAVGYYSRYDLGLKQFIHPAGIVVLTPRGAVSGYVLGIGYQPGDLRAAIIRASSGGVEQTVQPVLLLCFHFDPTTGRYTFAIMKVLRLTGLLTVLTLIAVMLILRRREGRA
jgi:protein SCO1